MLLFSYQFCIDEDLLLSNSNPERKTKQNKPEILISTLMEQIQFNHLFINTFKLCILP